MEKLFSQQNYLRRKARVALAENVGVFKASEFAEILDIEIGSYYNWINGAYDLSSKKARYFEDFLSDIVDY